MEQPLTILVELLNSALEQGMNSEKEFISVALPGEQLRRMLPLQDGDVSEAERVLARYDELLAARPVNASANLAGDLAAVLDEVERMSRGEDHDEEEWEDALSRVDDVLAVAAAAWRAGKLEKHAALALGEEATRRIRALAPDLSRAWDTADEIALCRAPDPDIPELYSFWEEVAAFAHERLLLEQALETPPAELRSRVVAAAVERIMAAEEERVVAAATWDEPVRPGLAARVREASTRLSGAFGARLVDLEQYQQLQAAAGNSDLENRLRGGWPVFVSPSWKAAVEVSSGEVKISVRPSGDNRRGLEGCTLEFLGKLRALGSGNAPNTVSFPIADLDLDEPYMTITMPGGQVERLEPND